MPSKLKTTIGQLVINEALPEELRDYNRVLDGKSLKALFTQVAQKYPERYREISLNLMKVGEEAAYLSGGNSVGLSDLRRPKIAAKIRDELRSKLDALDLDDSLSDDDREALIGKIVGGRMEEQQKKVYEEALASNNPLALQILAGVRGNKSQLNTLLGGDMLYEDHRGRIVPIPVLRSYSEGLTPAEVWAGAYGARKGVIANKLATAQSGYASKQLNQITHRLVVAADDADKPPEGIRGLPVDVDDEDNEGALLAHPVAGYPRDTVLTPKVLQAIRAKGIQRIVLRSPTVGGPVGGGLYGKDVGIRELGRFPRRGEGVVGMSAAQALGEPLTQSMLSAKHGGGVAGQNKSLGGFAAVEQMIQVPKTFKQGATLASLDGKVSAIAKAPGGGFNVLIGNQQHYVPGDRALTVREGDEVEAGDVLSEGTPNPAEIVKHKGIGEGRRYFANTMRNIYRQAGIESNRRNIELVARGLINHVRLTDELGEGVPGDIVDYQSVEASYQPREQAQNLAPKKAIGKYLEKPVLHYTIGTKIRPSVLKEFKDFGVNEVLVHDEPPGFEPEMIRAEASLSHDPDWMTRSLGSGLKKSLLQATHRGLSSDEQGTSFVPGLARGSDFGRVGYFKSSEDQLPGGEADNAPDSDFNPEQLSEGQEHETEHTSDRSIAREIAKDHLKEDPEYYKHLEKMEEKEAKPQADELPNLNMGGPGNYSAAHTEAFQAQKPDAAGDAVKVIKPPTPKAPIAPDKPRAPVDISPPKPITGTSEIKPPTPVVPQQAKQPQPSQAAEVASNYSKPMELDAGLDPMAAYRKQFGEAPIGLQMASMMPDTFKPILDQFGPMAALALMGPEAINNFRIASGLSSIDFGGQGNTPAANQPETIDVTPKQPRQIAPSQKEPLTQQQQKQQEILNAEAAGEPVPNQVDFDAYKTDRPGSYMGAMDPLSAKIETAVAPLTLSQVATEAGPFSEIAKETNKLKLKPWEGLGWDKFKGDYISKFGPRTPTMPAPGAGPGFIASHTPEAISRWGGNAAQTLKTLPGAGRIGQGFSRFGQGARMAGRMGGRGLGFLLGPAAIAYGAYTGAKDIGVLAGQTYNLYNDVKARNASRASAEQASQKFMQNLNATPEQQQAAAQQRDQQAAKNLQQANPQMTQAQQQQQIAARKQVEQQMRNPAGGETTPQQKQQLIAAQNNASMAPLTHTVTDAKGRPVGQQVAYSPFRASMLRMGMDPANIAMIESGINGVNPMNWFR